MWIEISLGAVALCALFYFYMTQKFDYWTKRGVYQLKPSFPYGTMKGFFTQKGVNLPPASMQSNYCFLFFFTHN